MRVFLHITAPIERTPPHPASEREAVLRALLSAVSMPISFGRLEKFINIYCGRNVSAPRIYIAECVFSHSTSSFRVRQAQNERHPSAFPGGPLAGAFIRVHALIYAFNQQKIITLSGQWRISLSNACGRCGIEHGSSFTNNVLPVEDNRWLSRTQDLIKRTIASNDLLAQWFFFANYSHAKVSIDIIRDYQKLNKMFVIIIAGKCWPFRL